MALSLTVKSGGAFWLDEEPVHVRRVDTFTVSLQCDGKAARLRLHEGRVFRGCTISIDRFVDGCIRVAVTAPDSVRVHRHPPSRRCCDLDLVVFHKTREKHFVAGCTVCGTMYVLKPRAHTLDPFTRRRSRLSVPRALALLPGCDPSSRRTLKESLAAMRGLISWPSTAAKLHESVMVRLEPAHD